MLQDRSKYIVSRNADSGDLVLAGDTSISRVHAFLYPQKDHIKLIDGGSKYGTFVNDNISKEIQIPKNKTIDLVASDKIRFGRLKNVWNLTKMSICSLSSTLSPNDKRDVQQSMTQLNGELISEWNSACNYLTISELTVTIKVLQALSAAIPIVTPKFWQEFVAAARQNQTLPVASDFQPPVVEEYVSIGQVSFGINNMRTCLFAGKTVVFMLNAHMEKYRVVIELAGGTCTSLDRARSRKSQLVANQTIVIQYMPTTQSQTSQDIGSVSEYLHKHGRRTIPEREIGMAIVHCSLEKFCNPLCTMIEDFLPIPQAAVKAQNVLAEATPFSETKSLVAATVEVPETMSDSDAKKMVPPRKSTRRNAKPEASSSTVTKRKAVETVDEPPYKKKMSTIDEVIELADTEIFVPHKDVEMTTKNTNIIVEKPPSSSWHLSDDEDDALVASMIEATAIDQQSEIEPNQITSVFTSSQSIYNLIGPSQDGFISCSKQNQSSTQPNQQRPKSPVAQPESSKFAKANLKRMQHQMMCSDNESDDDDVNPFKFLNPAEPVKRQRKNDRPPPPTPAQQINTSANSEHSQCAATAIRSNVTFNNASSFMSFIKPIPFTNNGWLSKLTLKSETDVTDAFLAVKKEEDWIESIRNGFEVQFKDLTIVNNSHFVTCSSAANVSHNSSAKNFKKFVKVGR